MSRLGRLRSLLHDWPAAGTFLADEVALCAGEWRDERATAEAAPPASAPAVPVATEPRLAAA